MTQVSLTQKTGWDPMGCCRNSVEECIDKVQNQALRLITGSMKSTPIRVMEETTATQPLSKRRDMRNIIQAERYK